jgi:dTDP-glucose 4,6-dehydratase
VLEHTRPYWELLRGERIFVTGATGFFGMWLLETFAFANARLELRAELVGLTRDSEGFRAKSSASCEGFRDHAASRRCSEF